MKKESTLSNRELVSIDDWFHDSDFVRTSMVLRIDFEQWIAEKKNTIYHLV